MIGFTEKKNPVGISIFIEILCIDYMTPSESNVVLPNIFYKYLNPNGFYEPSTPNEHRLPNVEKISNNR